MNEQPMPVVYRGETATRSKIAAALLTALHPALGYLYVGKPRRAVAAVLFFTAYIVVFVGLWAVFQFFPVLPMAAAVLGWLMLSGACLVSILGEADAQGEEYILRGFNHAVIYTVVYTMAGLIPMVAAYHTSLHALWGVVQINDDTMAPTLTSGDTILVDRMAFERATPQRGDKIVVSAADGKDANHKVVLSRIVGISGDKVEIKGGDVLVNDERLSRFVYGDDGMLPGSPVAGEPVASGERAFVEHHGARKYVIAGELGSRASTGDEPVFVEEGELLLMADNRGELTGEPFVTVDRDRILGQPRYILFSRTPQSDGQGEARWSRIGLRAD